MISVAYHRSRRATKCIIDLFIKCVEEAFSELPDIRFFSEVPRETVWKISRRLWSVCN
jgi:hypothetical protein